MVTADIPPSAIYAPASPLRASTEDARKALERLKASNPGTPFLLAEPSKVPGLIKLTLAGGKLAYTDKSGRYLIMGVIFDMSEGKAIDGAMDAVPSNSNGEQSND